MKKFRNTFTLVLLCCSSSLLAQLNPLGAQYFQNPYLANPAMAGLKDGIRLNLGFRSQWSNTPNAPKVTSISGDLKAGKVGLGISFYKIQAGLLDRSKLVASYAYHLILNNKEEQIHCGISLGFQKGRLNTGDIIGSINDQPALNFNDREIIYDGDFGMAYSTDRLTVEGTLINLKKQFKGELQNTADYNTSYLAISYKYMVNNWQVTPKLAYRGLRNYNDMVDLGAELKSNDQQLSFTALYHNNKTYSLGMSYLYEKQWQLIGLYTTTNAQQQNYLNGSFEIGIQLNLSKRLKED